MNITSIVSGPNRVKYLLLIVVLLPALVSFIFWNQKIFSAQGAEKVNIDISKQVTVNDNAIIFAPNSYLEELVKLAVLKKKSKIFDTTRYEFLDVKHVYTNKNAKRFILSLAERGTSNSMDKYSKKEKEDMILKIYDPQNLVTKEIDFLKTDQFLSIKVADINNSILELLKISWKSLGVALVDDTYNITQQNIRSLTIYPTGIVLNYSSSGESVTNDLVRKLDANFSSQNIGVSALFPFKFLTAISNSTRIYFNTKDPIIKGTYLQEISIENTASGEIKGKFKINNDDDFLFPAAINGSCLLTKERNTVLKIGEFTYNSANLSPSSVKVMNQLVKLCNDSIVPKLINRSLVPTFNNARLMFKTTDDTFNPAVKNGTISYFQDHVIYKINLTND